ncbi:MAG TPA: OmpA family protein [Candidatus Angelobacter sp.]|nr:OmpA family protein [Candidatus Angelobacter sp.]
MRFVVRFVATLILGSLLLTTLFAEDAAKASSNSTSPEPSATSTAYLAPAVSLFAPQAKSKSSSSSSETHPAADLFVGYSFVRFSTNTGGVKETFNWHGLTGSIAGNVNRWFSLVGDFGVYRIKDVPPNVSGSAYTFLFGPRFSKRGERWTPFVHALFGAARLSDITVTPPPTTSAFFNRSFSANSFATALGGGVDVDFNKHIGIRLFQAEYLLTKFIDGGDNKQNNLRASAGLVLHFGGNPPPPPPNHPPTVTVTANPTKVFAGSNDSVVLQAQGSDPDNDPLNYKWSATGGGIEGSGPEVRWNSSGVKEGKYTVTVTADDGKGGTANASTDITVEQKPNTPPVVSSCAANPATITVGQKSTVTTTASDADNDTLTYTYTTTGGRVTGSGASVQFDSTGAAPGTYTVNCHVSDGRGGEASGNTTITVQAPAPPRELEQRLSLHSIYFPTAQPVENSPVTTGLLASQKQTLIALAADFKKYLEFKPDTHLILQGHADPRGGVEYNKGLSERRVERTKAFLVAQGIDAGHIETQGLGKEEAPPMSADQIKQAVQQDQSLTAAQKSVLSRDARALALAQSRRVDVMLNTTGQTSVRQYPFNAEDALNLIDPKGVRTRAAAKAQKARTGGKTGPKTGTKKKKGAGAAKKQ